MALGSTQPLTEMITRSIYWGKGGRCVRLTTLPPSCAVVTKSGSLNFLEPSGPVQACNGTALLFIAVDSVNGQTYVFGNHVSSLGPNISSGDLLPLHREVCCAFLRVFAKL